MGPWWIWSTSTGTREQVRAGPPEQFIQSRLVPIGAARLQYPVCGCLPSVCPSASEVMWGGSKLGGLALLNTDNMSPHTLMETDSRVNGSEGQKGRKQREIHKVFSEAIGDVMYGKCPEGKLWNKIYFKVSIYKITCCSVLQSIRMDFWQRFT